MSVLDKIMAVGNISSFSEAYEWFLNLPFMMQILVGLALFGMLVGVYIIIAAAVTDGER